LIENLTQITQRKKHRSQKTEVNYLARIYLTTDLADELQKSKFSTAQGNFGKIIGIEGNDLCFVKV